MNRCYFFDTYALIEIIVGNKAYDKYLYKVPILTTKLNLMELYYGLLKKYGKSYADRYYDLFKTFIIKIDDDIIKDAMLFRLNNKKLSYVDCIGYITALKTGCKFLSGDNDFKNMENVEFVK